MKKLRNINTEFLKNMFRYQNTHLYLHVKGHTLFLNLDLNFEVEIDSLSSQANKTFTRFPRFMLLTVYSVEKCAQFTSILKVYNKLHTAIFSHMEVAQIAILHFDIIFRIMKIVFHRYQNSVSDSVEMDIYLSCEEFQRNYFWNTGILTALNTM